MTEKEVAQRGYRITGRVQGVFFRAFTEETARELGLQGTVKNVADGSVEAHARGPVDKLDAFEGRLGEGSPASRVENVEVLDSDRDLPSSFQIVY